MSSGVSESDAILLSAYLDGELSADERADLEKRLASDVALKKKLDGLTATRKLVHDTDTSAKDETVSIKDLARRVTETADIPVAPVVPAPKIRRIMIVLGAIIMALIAIRITDRLVQKMGAKRLPWNLEQFQGACMLERNGMADTLTSAQGMLAGDVLHVEPQASASWRGPEDAQVRLQGPGRVRFEKDGTLMLEEGALSLQGPAPSAAFVLVRTPDGSVKLKEGLDYQVVVEAKPAPITGTK